MVDLLRELNGKRAKIILNHKLFGMTTYKVDKLTLIMDEHRIGVMIKNQAKYVYKDSIIHEDDNSISDGVLTIKIQMY